MRYAILLHAALVPSIAPSVPAAGAAAVEVGFGKAEITPDPGAGPVWLAGFGPDRRATGVHDPLWARAVVLDDGEHRIALVSVDLIGLQYKETEAIRERLGEGFDYVLVASTHNHEGPDVIGLWGPSVRESGVDEAYLGRVVERTAAAVRDAEAELAPAEAAFGTAEDETLLYDSRRPEVKDGVLRVLSFTPPDRPDAVPLGMLVQWNCHPENLGSGNTLVTADFPHYVVRDLEDRYGCPVAYFTGAIGGLMSAPEHLFKRDDGTFYKEGEFEFAEVYGLAVAKLADRALRFAEPIDLAPFAVSAERVALPLQNNYYSLARLAGVLDRPGFAWTGDPREPGPERPGRGILGDLALITEVACLRLGQLHLAAIPGELYPELVAGQFQDPADPAADFPDAPLEPAAWDLLPDGPRMLFGLANDEVGYIIPRRQWDDEPPFAYGRDKSQYGEINSVGPEVAPILMEALRRRVAGLDAD